MVYGARPRQRRGAMIQCACMRWLASLTIAALFAPAVALAFPFGGQIQQLINCYNQAIYAYLSAPRGGPYIWIPSTKTYNFGPPAFVGQWLLGLASAPYYCLVSVSPIVTVPGTAIIMMGSSGSSAAGTTYTQNGSAGFTAQASPSSYSGIPGVGSGGSSGGTGSGSGSGSGTGNPTSIGHVVVSEVFYNVDPQHGRKPQNEWIELYNGSSASVDLSGWQITDDEVSRTLPSGTKIDSGSYLVVSDDESTATKWTIPSTAQFIALGVTLGNGLANAGDIVRLKDQNGQGVDSLSWGKNTSAFSPAIPTVDEGHSLARKTLVSDSNTASDWVDTPSPTPGK